MKPVLKQQVKRPPLPSRPSPQAVALKQELEVLEKQREEHSSTKRIYWVSGALCLGILLVIEFLKFVPHEPGADQPVAEQAPVASAPASPLPATTAQATTPKKATPAAKDTAPVQPTPATPSADETAAAEPTEAERMADEPEMTLVGMDAQRDLAKNRDQSLIKRAIEGPAWDAYRALLGRSIKAAMTKLSLPQGSGRFDQFWDTPVLYQAFLRWKTLGCFAEADIVPLIHDTYTGGMFTWLLGNNHAMEELLLTIDPKDDSAKVLKFLNDAWAMNQEKYEKYFSLALACAVVFDHPMTIPNVVGKEKYGKESVVDPMKRYMWYVTNNEKGRLAAPVHHSSGRDLVWVVCAPVTTSELEWSLDKMHLHRKNWGNAYGMVKYLMERAVNGLDPYKEYSFAEILKEGGICGDQSYFCVNTARAQGIPAMTIGGETDLGGHAWAGVKIDDREWSTSVGRIGGASKGQAGNPQTGGSISEQEILSWNDRHHQSKVTTLSVWRHLWLSDFFAAMDKADDQAATIHLANTLGRSFVETWKALFMVLERQTQLVGEPAKPNNLTEWQKFAADMRREFKDNPRMAQLAADAESEFIFPYGPEGDAKRSFLRERRRLDRNASEQKDLIATSLKREAELINKRGGPDAKRDISRLYDSALRDYGGSIPGFKMMAEDYFGYMKDDRELAHKAARDIELAFKRVVETGSKDWFRANTESSIYKMICEYYRTAGDEDRAVQLEKRYELLLRRAKRGAV